MVKHAFYRKTVAVMTAVSLSLSLCSCHEKLITDREENVEISFSWWGTDERNERILNGLNMFTAETKINVRPKYAEFEGFKSKMDTQINSGTSADVMQLNYDWLNQYTDEGFSFYDLSALESVDLSTYSDSSLACGRINGKLQAVPYGFNAATFVYNKTLFDSYGLEIPDTWNDLFEAAAVMRRDNVYVMGMSDKFFWLSSCAYMEQLTDHKVFNEQGELTLSESDMALMLGFGKRLIDEKVSKLSSEYDRRDFSMLRMAGTVCWTSDPGYFEAAAKESKMEVTVGPYLTSDTYTSFGWYQRPTGLYAIREDPKDENAAGMLLNYLINSEDMAAELGMSRGVPVSSSATEALEARGMLDGIEYEANRLMKNDARLRTMDPLMEKTELVDIYIDALNSIYYKNANVERAAKLAMDQMKRVKL